MTDEGRRECSSCGKTKDALAFSGDSLKCRECEENWTTFRKGIDEILNQTRPSRAHVSERDWREEAYAWARNHMPNERNIVRIYAERQVDGREKVATRRGNKLLRSWITGQMPLFWDDIGTTPIKVGDDHVRLDTATVNDARQFVRENRAAAKRDYDSRLDVCDAADVLADMAAERGFVRISQLGDLPARGEEEETG